MIIKHKQTAYYIHLASKIATSATKHAKKIIYKTDSTSIECTGAAAQAAKQAGETALV